MSLSPSPIFNKDDSMPSPIQAKRQQYATQTQRFASHSSDNDDDDMVEALDDQPSTVYQISGL